MRSEATMSRSSPSSYISRTLPLARRGSVTPATLPTGSEVIREVREDLAAVLRDQHEVLQAAAALALPVAPGLHRDHVAGHQRVRGPGEVRALVDLQADAVPERVEVAVAQDLAGRLGQLRRLPGRGERLAGGAEDGVRVGARAHHRVHQLQRLAAQAPVLRELRVRLPAAGHEGAGHVRPAARAPVLRPDVDDDRLPGLQRPRALVVALGSLRTAG